MQIGIFTVYNKVMKFFIDVAALMDVSARWNMIQIASASVVMNISISSYCIVKHFRTFSLFHVKHKKIYSVTVFLCSQDHLSLVVTLPSFGAGGPGSAPVVGMLCHTPFTVTQLNASSKLKLLVKIKVVKIFC
jgi:hypothetical protein